MKLRKLLSLLCAVAVSYTHLDVYKRQGHGDALLPQQGEVLPFQPHAVSRGGGSIKDAQVIEVAGGGFSAVAGFAGLLLIPGFGEVQVHPQPRPGGQLGHPGRYLGLSLIHIEMCIRDRRMGVHRASISWGATMNTTINA